MYDPQVAAILQDRLDIAEQLDVSPEISFLERARFRLELVTIVDTYERGHADKCTTEAALDELRKRISTVVATA
jgi:hypothetical protein